jgi:hypothetical protein
MSYDPNQPPNSGYGNPPYGQPQPPYGQPQQGPYGPPPQGPYGQPQPPYVQPQGPYGQPQQGPYGPPYQEQGYSMPPVQAAPLPLGEAIRQLPNQYIRVLTKPSAATFAAEQGKAAWNIVWIQLIIYAVILVVLGYIGSLIGLSFGALSSLMNTGSLSSSGMNPATLQAVAASSSFGEIILVPLGFFIVVGVYYLVAKAFGGQGTFLAQGYNYLLYQVPIGILGGVIALIPILGGIVAFALYIYGIVLNVFLIMATHRLSGGKATAVVLIPIAVIVVLSCVLGVIFFALIAAALRQTHP